MGQPGQKLKQAIFPNLTVHADAYLGDPIAVSHYHPPNIQ